MLFLFLFRNQFTGQAQVNTAWWIALVLIIDVGHVYSTLYRTYFDKQQWILHKPKLLAIPIISLFVAMLLYQMGDAFFWRIMAYTAVFHFIRQQYGLVKVYQRKEQVHEVSRWAVYAVYASMLYPLVYWHCYGPFEFNWFTSDDFIFWKNPLLEIIARLFYIVLLLAFLVETIMRYVKTKYYNLPVLLIVTGTAINWYFGIVYFESDFSFTLLNVISHGIPYIALVWLFGEKQALDPKREQYRFQPYFFKRYGIFLFLLLPLLLGFVEEGFWDAFVWKDHPEVFSFFYSNAPTKAWVSAILVPLLITPQLTHYILDGFIWKVSKGHVTV